MRHWLSYSGAFACALGAAILSYMAAFHTLMVGSGAGFAGFIFLAVICPVLVALIIFGVIYRVFSGNGFDIQQWCVAIALVAVATTAAVWLIIADKLEEVPAALLWVITLFVGGHLMIRRATNA